MINELLTIPAFPRLKVSIRTVSRTYIVYEFNLIPDIYGLDVIGLGQQKWTNVQRWSTPMTNDDEEVWRLMAGR